MNRHALDLRQPDDLLGQLEPRTVARVRHVEDPRLRQLEQQDQPACQVECKRGTPDLIVHDGDPVLPLRDPQDRLDKVPRKRSAQAVQPRGADDLVSIKQRRITSYNVCYTKLLRFGILIAQASGGQCQSGWIYDCLSGRFCHAHLGKGAYVDGEPIAARTTGREPPLAAISLVFVSRITSYNVCYTKLLRMEKHHPTFPHAYLFIIGVRQSHQGKGLGGKLFRPVLDACDRLGVPAYLENSNPASYNFV